MDTNESKKVGILGGCFLVRSALVAILADLKLPYVTADDPADVPPDASVVLLSFVTADGLLSSIEACIRSPNRPRIALFPQDEALLDSVGCLPNDVAAIVTPTLATAEIKSMISLVADGHRILPFAMTEGQRPSLGKPIESIRPGLLTHRQLEILEELAKGGSNKSIARTLSISINTVEAHVSRIICKLKVENRTQAALALREGMPLPKISAKNRLSPPPRSFKRQSLKTSSTE